MEIGKEESNVQNAQLSMQELYGKTQEPPHKKVPLTENMQYSDRERIHAYWLSRVDGIGAVTAAKLYESCGSFEGIYERVLYNRKKLDPFICSFLGKAVKKGLEEAVLLFKQRVEEYDRLEEQGVRFILCGEAAYPKRLMHIYDKPMWLFVRGMLPEDAKPSAAVIGARSCTPYGRQEAEYFGRILAENGVQVVSGMALGIDQAGHKGAMDGGGLTYAVMGCGIDTCYPPSGIRLHARIREQGGILSEYGPGVPPTASHFPIRNRIISGLSDAVLVVEAKEQSGSLITANFALEHGHSVYAVPGAVTDELSRGCNKLIFDGAGIAYTPEIMLMEWGIQVENPPANIQKKKLGLAPDLDLVYSGLDLRPENMDHIIRKTGFSAAKVCTILTELQLMGLVQETGRKYCRVPEN